MPKLNMRKQPKLNIVMRAVSELLPYARNSKTHPPEQIKKLAKFIERIGFRVPVSIDGTGVVIAGHGRLLAAKKLGMTEVPCIVHDDLTDAEAKALRLADNRFAELATSNKANIAAELESLSFEFSVADLGFSDDDLAKLNEASEATLNEIDVSELREEFWISIRGNLPKQPEVIQLLQKNLSEIEGLQVQIGTTGHG